MNRGLALWFFDCRMGVDCVCASIADRLLGRLVSWMIGKDDSNWLDGDKVA